ncbi:hypothetical protein Ssi03_74400 [Sphaerisporangium siamense]|uniref:Uncharacterized protein n=1 Tax=Sphaerisporangium siamense TaxID=795645 RepID=A0A7W7GAD1_9ACTN|nr:hypothetical protein [Sphaerisporangium siamense]MBB4702292.1 hypothetical protein [Sphaerisporangium siamense]GII89450.1 hypothetical protein Ssi03_74400 [Sphaerisporangium siamense]
MTNRKDRERTVAFYEIVSDKHERMTQIDWPKILAGLFGAPIKDRMVRGRLRTLVGQVVTYQETDHLLLGKVKDAAEWIEQVNFEDGSIEQFNSAENRGLLETSVMCFLPYGNIVGMIRGSTSAPGSNALAEWINGIDILEGEVDVRAIVSKSAMDKIQKADGAQTMEFRVGTSKAAAVADANTRLGRTIHTLRQEYGDAKITIIVDVPKDKSYRRAHRELLDDVMQLAAITDVAENARAKLTYFDATEEAEAESVNLMQERITAKRRISSFDAQGQLIRNSSAVGAIMTVAAEVEHALRLAVDAIDR